MSVKIGEANYEWVLLHIRNGEQIVGLFNVGALKEGDAGYQEEIVRRIMDSKDVGGTDHIIPLSNPHQLAMGANGALVVMAMSVGNKIIFLRSGEVLFVQFLDQASPVVKQIRQAQSGIVVPETPGTKTEGGLILPGPGGVKP